ncbi:hypothetical protein PSEUDO8O_30815 [Pseudomonas sp. 8O]|nr:hypothetical protein PSEUDO8O_30815 [Pseudomonas sp. 8O]
MNRAKACSSPARLACSSGADAPGSADSVGRRLASICFSRTTHRQKTVGYKSFSNPRAYFFILIYQSLEKTKPELASKLRLSGDQFPVGCAMRTSSTGS